MSTLVRKIWNICNMCDSLLACCSCQGILHVYPSVSEHSK